jgi:uncharacterized membrane protein YphA (DoxX/SURF4 family)
VDSDQTRESRAAMRREAAGVILIGVGILGGFGGLLILGGLGVTLVAVAATGVTAFGRWLATGTPSETEGDFEPIGPGPLWQDPNDPQSFIPRT